jgi:hypothetical protein
LRVVLEAETTILDGVAAGAGAEEIQDGWTANFGRFIAVIGDVHAVSVADPGDVHRAAGVIAVDLTQLPAGGKSTWQLAELPTGRWQFGYAVLGGERADTRDSSVSRADYDAMRAAEWSYWLDLELSKLEGQSCPPPGLAKPPTDVQSTAENAQGVPCYANPSVHLELGIRAVTHYGPCQREGVSDFSVPSGGTKTIAATLHGDHLFFNGFPEGGEGGIHRYAQWLADCDLDLDGQVTRDELAQISISELSEIDDRYQTGGAPLDPSNMLEYVAAQLMTQGHFDGEGECQARDVDY